MKFIHLTAVITAALSACAEKAAISEARRVASPDEETIRSIDAVAQENGLVTAGFAVIQDGEISWTHYYGEETPGVPATDNTRFNVASVTKAVTAETALRLAAEGALDLDEPLSAYWIDPDIADDPRVDQITARLILTHKTGFPNWRYFTESRKLSFKKEPGSTFTYSGEGFDYLMTALERKLERPFPEILSETVFSPIGMTSARLEVDREDVSHIARPVDADGKFYGYYCYPYGYCVEDGSYNAADDLIVTAPDYARFLISVMKAEGYDEQIEADRDRVQIDMGENSVVACDDASEIACPHTQGYGLGLEVIHYDDFYVIGHGGSDWAELALAYFYKPSNDGVIIFLNAPNRQAIDAMSDLIAAIDEDSPYLSRYRRWRALAAENDGDE